MSKPVLLLTPSLVIGLDVIAVIRHGAVRDLDTALRNGEQIPEGVVETIRAMDAAGAAWANKSKAGLSSDLSSVADRPFVPVEWDSMTAQAAADTLGVTRQAVGQLLDRESLHGEKSGRRWRVCSESVAARKEGSTCQH